MNKRPDLDGLRLKLPNDGNVWLIFQGRRHRIESSEVYDSLFNEIDGIVEVGDVSDIPTGPDLNNGTCLIRAFDALPIYLVTGYPVARRHFIPTYESLQEFKFNLDKVVAIPGCILEEITLGDSIEGANDRQTRSPR